MDVKLKKVTTIFRGLRRSQIDFSKGILRCQDEQHTVTYRDQELVLSVVKKLGRFTVIDMVITALPNLIHHIIMCTYKPALSTYVKIWDVFFWGLKNAACPFKLYGPVALMKFFWWDEWAEC